MVRSEERVMVSETRIRRNWLAIVCLAMLMSLVVQDVRAQRFGGNSVSGYVYGVNHRGLGDMNVELLDEYHRTVARSRTNGSGYYSFNGFREGRYSVIVYTSGTEYEEQEQEFIIQNISYETAAGSQTGGFADESKDFYMRLRPGVNPANVVIFVQEVPAEAEKLFKKAVSDLDAKRQAEGLAGLRAAIEKFPTYYYAMERLGTEYVRMGRPETFQAAALLLDAAVRINPNGFKSWYGLAYSQYALGNEKAAAEAVKKAIEINRFSPDAYLLNGALLRNAKDYTEAEKQLVKARELANSELPQIHRELGLLYGENMQKYTDAAKELKLYLKARPDARDADDLKKKITDHEERSKRS